MSWRRDVVLALLVIAALVAAYRAGRDDERREWEAAAAEAGDINPDPCPGYAAR